MRFKKDETHGYMVFPNDGEGKIGLSIELLDMIQNNYGDEEKELGDYEYSKKKQETLKSILDGNYQCRIDQLTENDWIVIEPEFGFGNIEFEIKEVVC